MKMRDDARAARMAYLEVWSCVISTLSATDTRFYKKNAFDLTRGQERIASFEEELRARNSPALYPNHLGSAIKFYYMRQPTGAAGPEGRDRS